MTPTAPMPSAEQEQFGRALHGLLAATGSTGAARQWADGDPAAGLRLWHRLAGQGVTALAVPEKWGGLGASMLDVVVACEELGHHALPGPAAESLAAVPHLLTALCEGHLCDTSADGEQCARWLAALADGSLVATLALPPRLPYLLDAHVADLVLLAEAGTVRLATPGTRHQSVDGARWLSEVCGGPVIAQGPAVAEAAGRALRAGALASAAQLLGAGRALLEASITHARQRTQFGRPVGAFQAVKHALAGVAIDLEFARPLAYAAAEAMDAGRASAGRDVAAARVAGADAAYRAARTALQVHGAIGYTHEHDLSLWLTKVTALRSAWGTQAEHRAAVMAALTGDGPANGEPSWT
ncbi:MAG TPA: acyl-CoA dehydrogenase family protein [Streptosporangiaceae bacterium]|nr:acyl-CoA dehydrogenase family protein [Streptosporangiaceae bacterium]